MNNLNINEEKLNKIVESYKKTREYQNQYCKDNLPDFRIRNRQYHERHKDNEEFKLRKRESCKRRYFLKELNDPKRYDVIQTFKIMPNYVEA